MITVIFPRKAYSENKIKLNQTIKKHNMSWDSEKDGWVNSATGDGVFVDKNVMEMIIGGVFSDQPMTMYVESKNADFIRDFESHCSALGGQFIKEDTSAMVGITPKQTNNLNQASLAFNDVFVKLNYRNASGSNTMALQEKAYADLQDISGRWERRKKQLLVEYEKMGLEKRLIDTMLHREEIAFRKNNACWVTGEFPVE